jgi:Protein of unknown function (DUF2795)
LGISPRVAGDWWSTLTRSCGICSVTTFGSRGIFKSINDPLEETIVDFDPGDAPQYLEGVDYPASKEDLASAAEGHGAPEGLGMIL